MSNWLGDLLSRILRDLVAQFRPDVNRSRRSRSTRRRTTGTSSNTGQRPNGSRRTGGSRRREYPGDFTGTPRITYSPAPGKEADPGEVVWTWVPYEEDHREGKDRPVLIIGRDHEWLLGLLLTSKDHDRDAAQEARSGRFWMDIGTGEWDPQRRPSEVRINRIIRIDPDDVRRIGAVLDRDVFDAVAAAVRA
ncbi:type II toxin-antitoxin system PemK/MazF family toxin [[Pseudopropionibacterium] massiliense]|uniref:type II toxin-antitoxin system PemK/MazF family toxin n=1 Tax=[Pseudopropionibacterium] massiliense TaxID=2220000 RepID=UPI0010307AF7|nr:type II toxin-antitoxin system PemK/MazF family toxin [[Pseudopropionibacterium] massiliense]